VSDIFCLILNKLRFSLHIFLSFPILNFIKIHPVGDEVICTDTQGEVFWAGNDLQHEVLGVTYTVCRLKECSHHIACPNVQAVLRIISSSKQHLSSYNTHVNNNVKDNFKSAGSPECGETRLWGSRFQSKATHLLTIQQYLTRVLQ
jgi:hypothetical protein